MPLTTTATWPALANRTASAADVNAKFAWLEGHRYPMDGGALTTGVFDIGSAAYEWNNLFLSELNLSTGTFTMVDGGLQIHAWGNVDCAGGTTTVNQSFNVTSVIQAGFTGTFTINLTGASGVPIRIYTPKNTNAIIHNQDLAARRMKTWTHAGVAVDSGFCFMATGRIGLTI